MVDSFINILVINPGSTSTKIAVYQNENLVVKEGLRHTITELASYTNVIEQLSFRREKILEFLKERKISLNSLSAVVGRGGLLGPLPGGTYAVNYKMMEDVKQGLNGEHASNLGALLAYDIAHEINVPSFIVDPPTVDEMLPIAKISGLPEIERRSAFHALNVKAVYRKACEDLNKEIDSINLVVAHLGGGISVSALKKGKAIDVTNALEEGPFTPERAGALPTSELIKLIYSQKNTEKEMKRRLIGEGGMAAYLGTTDAVLVEKRIWEGDQKAGLVMEAMAYQIAKEIGSMATVLKGEIDAIALTGGLAHSKMVTDIIRQRVEFLAPVKVYPGEDELKALALGALRVLQGKEQALEY